MKSRFLHRGMKCDLLLNCRCSKDNFLACSKEYFKCQICDQSHHNWGLFLLKRIIPLFMFSRVSDQRESTTNEEMDSPLTARIIMHIIEEPYFRLLCIYFPFISFSQRSNTPSEWTNAYHICRPIEQKLEKITPLIYKKEKI